MMTLDKCVVDCYDTNTFYQNVSIIPVCLFVSINTPEGALFEDLSRMSIMNKFDSWFQTIIKQLLIKSSNVWFAALVLISI